jgi:hypothetical protein
MLRGSASITNLVPSRGIAKLSVVGTRDVRLESAIRPTVVYDRLREWDEPDASIVVAVNFGSPPLDAHGRPSGGPLNRRAEMWMKSSGWRKRRIRGRERSPHRA